VLNVDCLVCIFELFNPAGSGQEERYVSCISLVQDIMSIALAVPYTKFILAPYTKVNVELA
jgi:hypothetical protein